MSKSHFFLYVRYFGQSHHLCGDENTKRCSKQHSENMSKMAEKFTGMAANIKTTSHIHRQMEESSYIQLTLSRILGATAIYLIKSNNAKT